jgi:hypothetical protein
VKTLPAIFTALVLFAAPLASASSALVPTSDERLTRVERRVDRLYSGLASVGFIVGAICALWAQNTARNAWLWFFAGFFLSFFALLALLYQNSRDLERHQVPRGGGSP